MGHLHSESARVSVLLCTCHFLWDCHWSVFTSSTALSIKFATKTFLVSVPVPRVIVADWDGLGEHDRVHRQLSVSSDSKLLDEDIREEARVILRPKKPPRPKSEVFLNKEQQRRTKRYSAFGVSCPTRPRGCHFRFSSHDGECEDRCLLAFYSVQFF